MEDTWTLLPLQSDAKRSWIQVLPSCMWHSLERFWVPIAARPTSSRAEESLMPFRRDKRRDYQSLHSIQGAAGCRGGVWWSFQGLKVSWILIELIHSNICVFDLIVHQMKSNGGKPKQLQICKNEIVNTDSQISFLHRAAGLSLRDRVRGSE